MTNKQSLLLYSFLEFKAKKGKKMNLNGDLSQLKCSIDDHFIQKPIGLECGHCVCTKCIPRYSIQTNQEIRCLICEKTTNIKNDYEINNIKMMIEKCLPSMFTEIEKDTNEAISKFKSIGFLNL